MDSMNPCCCCLLRLPEKDLKTPYIHLGVTEIFAEMLKDCFKIQLAVNEENWGICEQCVSRLRDARDFKLQVQRSQEKLWARLKLQHVKKEDRESVSNTSNEEDVMDNEQIHIEITQITDLKSEAPPVDPKAAQPGASTEQLATYSNTTKMYETVLQCDLCLSTFGQESTLEMHMKKMHNNLSNVQPKNEVCDTFEKQFTMFCSNSQQSTSLRRSRRTFICRICATVFNSRHLLSEHHRNVHKKKREHICDICGKKFKKKYKCTEHARTHTGQKPFSCEICNKRFTAHSTLMIHMRIHTGNVFICDICDKRYTRRYELVLHMRAHIGYKPYKCDLCNMQFINKASLEQHKAVHSDVKSYSCDVCGKRFKRKEHLKSHSYGHTGHKPYSCDICDQKFTAKTNVRRHKEKIHGQKRI